MSEMVERVAMAIGELGTEMEFFRAEKLARAAIEAMREPSDAMIKAGNKCYEGFRYPSCITFYEEMIDAALKD